MRLLSSRFLPGALILLPNLFFCASPYIADTMVYADSVMRHLNGQTAQPFQPLWEFGHLLWRPLGALLAPLFFATVPDSLGHALRIKLAFGFLAVNMLAGLGIAALLYDLFRRLAGWKAAALLTFGLSWSGGFLMYTLSGSSYITGLLFEVAAIWLLIPFSGGPPCAGRQWTAGVLAALGSLFWFPYILAIPAVAAVPWAMNAMHPRDGIPALLRVGLTSAACILAVMGAGAWLAGARTPAAAAEWFRDASHQWQQNRQWMRAVSGVPRLMVDLSRDGVVLKRFTFHDPFHPVSAWDVARLSLWKLAVFYAFLFSVLIMAARAPRGRSALALLLIAGVPMLLFAIVLFEPSSPERFLPVLPFLLLACAAGWRGPLRWVAGGVMAALPVINAPVFIEAFSPEQQSTFAQIEDYDRHAAPADLLVTVTFSDPLPQWLEQRIYHRSMRNRVVPTWQLIEVSTGRAQGWKERFATRVLRQWDGAKADVWIRQGALRGQPDEILRWVEGDNPALRWADVPAFLNLFDYDRRTELPVGFSRLARSEKNRRILEPLAAIGGDQAP